MKLVRYWTVVGLLLVALAILHGRGEQDFVPVSEPLGQLPAIIGPWSGRDLPIGQDIRSVLGKGDFLSRLYTRPGNRAPIDLFIGYFPTQRTGQSIHSPQNCLPGAGWMFVSSRYATLHDGPGKGRQVGEYLISNGEQKLFVIYWYQAHGRSIANEYVAKAHMVLDAIRMHRTDGALVRVITPVEPYETFAQAKDRALLFTDQMAPMLPRFIPN
jgi:EpsI family protein